MLTNELTQLGFNKKQALIYTTLLKLGPSRIGVIEQKTKLHKQILYTELSRMEERGIVFVTMKNNRKEFRAADPSVLLQKHEEQKVLLEQTVPQLHALVGWEQGASEINTYEGVKAVQTFHELKVKKTPRGSTICILGAGGSNWVKAMQANNAMFIFDGIRERRNIAQQALMHENQRKGNEAYVDGRFKHQVKFLDNPIVNTMAIQIFHDCVSLMFFLDTPKIVEIKSPQAMQTFQSYFDLLWKQGKA